jgi:hypothetical protein
MSLPMLADFAIRLLGGLAAVLVATPWRVVPPQFFRTHCQVILGLAVLSTLVVSRSEHSSIVFGLCLTLSILAFVATIVWGLGLPRLGVPVAILIALVSSVALCLTVDDVRGDYGLEIRTLNAASRVASSFLLGSALTAMLLGHHYLTAPAMSIAPLRRFVQFMAIGLTTRVILALLALTWLVFGPESGSIATISISPLFIGIRWGMGFLGFGLATFLAWKTVLIRSTQSATGILYIAMTLLLFGELTSLILARESHLLI